MALKRVKGILARVTALSILVSCLVSLASMRMAVQAQRPIVVSADQPNIWTLEQALQKNEALEEKIKDVKATLNAESGAFATTSGRHSLRSATSRDEELRPTINAALRI